MSGVLDSTLSLEPDNNLNIKWFFSNRTNYESELTTGINETRREGGNGMPVVISSTLVISGMLQGNAAVLAKGSYYCRVQVEDPTMRANSSQQFIALTQNEYLQSSSGCDRATFIAGQNTCAVRNIGTNPITTSPTPSTVDSNSTSSMQEGTTSESTLGEDNQSTDPVQSSPDRNGGGSALQVWIYVLVAVAAVFAMIIIILAIMCVGLCLRRSQSTMDTNCKLPTSLVHNMDANNCITLR